MYGTLGYKENFLLVDSSEHEDVGDL